MEYSITNFNTTPDEDNGPMVNYNHLRPPLQCLNLTFEDSEIVHPSNNPAIPFKRNIFYSVPYDSKEKEIIENVHKFVNFDGPKPPKWWRYGDYLRFIYEFDWDVNLICDWLKDIQSKPLSEAAKELLDNGVVYQIGRDKRYRPMVIIRADRIEQLKGNESFVVEALEHLLILIREKMLLPYYVERWSLLVDTSDSAINSNLNHLLDEVYGFVRNQFPCTIHKIYFMNVSLMSDVVETWNPFSRQNEKSRLVVLSGKYDGQLFNDFNRAQVEKRFGGDLIDLEKFWPPQATIFKKEPVRQDKRQGLFSFKLRNTEINQSYKASQAMGYSTIGVSKYAGERSSLRKIKKPMRPQYQTSMLYQARQSAISNRSMITGGSTIGGLRSKSFVPQAVPTLSVINEGGGPVGSTYAHSTLLNKSVLNGGSTMGGGAGPSQKPSFRHSRLDILNNVQGRTDRKKTDREKVQLAHDVNNLLMDESDREKFRSWKTGLDPELIKKQKEARTELEKSRISRWKKRLFVDFLGCAGGWR